MSESNHWQEHTEAAMEQDHPFAVEHIPAYVLGALDGKEEVRIIRHLDRCPHCRVEYQVYQEIAAALAYAVPPRDPPSHLRTAIHTQIAPTPDAVSVRMSGRSALAFPLRLRPSSGWLSGLALITIALVLWWNTRLHRHVQALDTHTTLAENFISMVIHYQMNPQAYAMHEVSGSNPGTTIWALLLYRRQQGYGMLFVEGLPALPRNRVYQVWFFDSQGKRISGGIFRSTRDGRAIVEVRLPFPLERLSAIGITQEPKGGSLQPTGIRVLDGELRPGGGHLMPIFTSPL